MSEILIYTEPMNSSVIRKLTNAGIIPVRVKNLESVRLLSVEPNILSADVILRSSLVAIATDDGMYRPVMTKFVRGLRNCVAPELAAADKAKAKP